MGRSEENRNRGVFELKRLIILDFGNGSEHGNDLKYIKKMIDKVIKLRAKTDKELIVKFQIWDHGNKLIDERLKSTDIQIFNEAFYYGKDNGLKVTSSVFDKWSLQFVKQYDPRFIKIACIPELYYLTNDENSKFVVSVPNYEWANYFRLVSIPTMYAIRKYPAFELDYIHLIETLPEFDILDPAANISDHTSNFSLYKKYQPNIYECHVCLEKKEGIFDNSFVRKLDDLKEIL